MATTMHWLPNFSAAARTNWRSATAAELIDALSAPASSRLRMSSIVRTPPPTVSGMKQTSAVRLHDVEQDAAVLVARGDVEKAQFVGAGLVIGDGAFDRIAGVAQVDEIDALDDAAVLDVETGNDAGFEHHSAAVGKRGRLMKSQKIPNILPEHQSDDVMSATKNRREPANLRNGSNLDAEKPLLRKHTCPVEGVHLAPHRGIDEGLFEFATRLPSSNTNRCLFIDYLRCQIHRAGSRSERSRVSTSTIFAPAPFAINS